MWKILQRRRHAWNEQTQTNDLIGQISWNEIALSRNQSEQRFLCVHVVKAKIYFWHLFESEASPVTKQSVCMPRYFSNYGLFRQIWKERPTLSCCGVQIIGNLNSIPLSTVWAVRKNHAWNSRVTTLPPHILPELRLFGAQEFTSKRDGSFSKR